MTDFLDTGSVLFKKRHPQVGARPGTLMINDEAPPPCIHLIRYTADNVREQEIDDIEMLTELIGDPAMKWIDVRGFGDETLLRRIGEIFQLHALVLEDIVNLPQRPKTESYGDQVLTITRMIKLTDNNAIDMEQVSILLGKGYVVTFQEREGDIFDPVRDRIRHGKGRPIRLNGADYLAYAILDTIIDGYYPVIESLGDHLERMENIVMENPTTQTLQELNRTKNMLVNLRRIVWPHRELVSSLMRDENELIHDNVRLYLRDTYDHCLQTGEVIEMYRDMATGLMNIYLSSVANRTNDVMKVLTIMASIFIPLTFMAGIYGMNFEHMPELHVRWAYPAIWFAMLTTAAGMLIFFYRKGWIGRG